MQKAQADARTRTGDPFIASAAVERVASAIDELTPAVQSLAEYQSTLGAREHAFDHDLSQAVHRGPLLFAFAGLLELDRDALDGQSPDYPASLLDASPLPISPRPPSDEIGGVARGRHRSGTGEFAVLLVDQRFEPDRLRDAVSGATSAELQAASIELDAVRDGAPRREAVKLAHRWP